MKNTKHVLFGVVLWCAMNASQAATQWHRLVWDSDPAHQATIAFSPLVSSTDPYVLYGVSTDESEWAKVPAAETRTFQFALKTHFVRLAGLPENAPVYYRVCDQDGCGQRFWFKTAPTDDSPFVVVAGGDTRTGWGNRKLGNQLIAKIRPLFIMHGGDYTNLNLFIDMGTYLADWELTFSDDVIEGVGYKRIYPFVPTHGNHEDNDYTTLCTVFGVDFNQDGECNKFDTYGAFNISPLLRVYTLNSQFQNSGYASYAAAMNEWLYNDLAVEGTTAEWRFAQYHKPMFPHYSGKSNNTQLFNWWSELFYDHAMNLVVESDTHINKLTKALKPVGDDFEAVNDGGTVYVGEGSWGAPSRSANNPKDWTIDLASIQQFKVIQVTRDEVTVGTAQFDEAAETLTLEQRSADSSILPDGINWWLANDVGTQVKLTKAANRLSVIGDDSVGGEDRFVSLAVVDDTFLSSKKGDTNFDASSEGLLVDGFDFDYGEMASLLKFDLMNMPSCIDTDAALLVLDIKNNSGNTFELYAGTRAWNEETATWDSLDDIDGALLTTFKPSTEGQLEINLAGTGIVEKWLLEGNYGLVFKAAGAINGFDFESKETGNAAVLKLAYDEQVSCAGEDTVEVAHHSLSKSRFERPTEEEIVLAFSLNSENNNAQLERIAVTASGDLNETQLSAVRLYVDSNQDGVPDEGERVASGAFGSDNGELEFILNSPYQLPAGEARLLVTYQF